MSKIENNNKDLKTSADTKDDLQVYGVFRDYIKHEDSLINNRMTWMLSIHGFLYGVFGFTLQKLLEVFEKSAYEIALNACSKSHFIEFYVANSALQSIVFETRIFLYSVCVVGLAISSSALRSITSAYDAVFEIKRIFETMFKSYRLLPRRHVARWKFDAWSRVYHLRTSGAWVKAPLLTGGGRPAGARSGFGAAWLIPLALFLSWIASMLCIYFYLPAKSEIIMDQMKCENTPEKTPF